MYFPSRTSGETSGTMPPTDAREFAWAYVLYGPEKPLALFGPTAEFGDPVTLLDALRLRDGFGDDVPVTLVAHGEYGRTEARWDARTVGTYPFEHSNMLFLMQAAGRILEARWWRDVGTDEDPMFELRLDAVMQTLPGDPSVNMLHAVRRAVMPAVMRFLSDNGLRGKVLTTPGNTGVVKARGAEFSIVNEVVTVYFHFYPDMP